MNTMSRQLYSMSLPTAEMKAKAEVYYGDEICKAKFTLLLSQIGFPDGLLTLEDIEEGGYVEDIGFVWLKRKKMMKEHKFENIVRKKMMKKEHKFENIVVCYDAVVTAYLEPNRIKNLTGVKAKEFLVWISLSEIYVNNDNHDSAYKSKLITFKTSMGLSKSFPISAFE
ncbi:hypothetical protein L484_005956 [Morus notabilis]|uniref:Uncharacterized protein n=1 Tax=Morus notabilis TaxID=981085 RepID=W9RJA9_9ROSA|nr:hypothetical protein L484_005956 [Morus notabilis]